MNKRKIINDPVYGFITIPTDLIFDLIEHPYFQRLRRIKQVSMTHLVYPGALHTRFHHALGALHLVQEAVSVLCNKGVELSEEEKEAVYVAILLHDVGHGPFSHTLEHTLIPVSHEKLSIWFMEALNEEFEGRLNLAIRIFQNQYHEKPFLFQLVSGQLDMDRMDYLNRDSFFTGVHEGVIGYDRIIKMLNVKKGQLVVEEKGIYSLEKFLQARRLMYWQVYLHKTVLVADQMLLQTIRRAKELSTQGNLLNIPGPFSFFVSNDITKDNFEDRKEEMLRRFAEIDDTDIAAALKIWKNCDDRVLSHLADSLLNRRLFKIILRSEPIDSDFVNKVRRKLKNKHQLTDRELDYLVLRGEETTSEYSTSKSEILILFKDGSVRPMSESTDYGMTSQSITKYFLCFPKSLQTSFEGEILS